ncbi:MAG TPA: ANTAR domain-containing protein [Blastocatellia bacterium]|nr:ANTAR domain-containing protein [Blastocatellia bacterium]
MVQQAGVAPMRVCIFSPEEELCESLAFDSRGAGYGVEQKFNQPQKLVEFISRSNSDHIVLIDARRQREEGLKLIKELCSDGPVAMVALANEADISLGSRAVEAGAQAVLVDPVKAKDICFAFTVAVHQQAKQARLQSEIHRLREKLAERKLIEKAKGILMDAAKVTEAEAFRLIQRESQDKRKSMAEIATSIISATQLVEEAARARLD